MIYSLLWIALQLWCVGIGPKHVQLGGCRIDSRTFADVLEGTVVHGTVLDLTLRIPSTTVECGAVSLIVLRDTASCVEFAAPGKPLWPPVRSPSPGRHRSPSPVKHKSPSPVLPDARSPISTVTSPISMGRRSPQRGGGESMVEPLIEGLLTLRLLEATNILGITADSACYAKVMLCDDVKGVAVNTTRSDTVRAKHLRYANYCDWSCVIPQSSSY
jgi:hypothetical protein